MILDLIIKHSSLVNNIKILEKNYVKIFICILKVLKILYKINLQDMKRKRERLVGNKKIKEVYSNKKLKIYQNIKI